MPVASHAVLCYCWDVAVGVRLGQGETGMKTVFSLLPVLLVCVSVHAWGGVAGERLHGESVARVCCAGHSAAEPVELTGRQLRQAIRRTRLQFLLLGMVEAGTLLPGGIDMPVDFLGDDRVLESDNFDDDDEDIRYGVRAVFTDLAVEGLRVFGKQFPERDTGGVPTWHLTLTVDTIATRADVDASADLSDMDDDWSWLDFLPRGTAETSGRARLTIRHAAVPVDVTVGVDEDGEAVSRFTIIPPDREHELDEGSKDLDVDLRELSAYDYDVSESLLDLMEPAIEELLYEELDIESLLSKAAGEVLDAPLSF